MRYSPRYNIKREFENRLAEIRVEEGYTAKMLSDASGVSIASVYLLQTGMTAPFYESGIFYGKIKPWVQKICDVLKTDLTYMFPREICEIAKSGLTEGQTIDILMGKTDGPEKRLLKNELKDMLDRLLATITEREEYVIRSYYFDGMTYDEIARIMIPNPVTRERVRQIILRGLRKLRHHTRADKIKGYMG